MAGEGSRLGGGSLGREEEGDSWQHRLGGARAKRASTSYSSASARCPGEITSCARTSFVARESSPSASAKCVCSSPTGPTPWEGGGVARPLRALAGEGGGHWKATRAEPASSSLIFLKRSSHLVCSLSICSCTTVCCSVWNSQWSSSTHICTLLTYWRKYAKRSSAVRGMARSRWSEEREFGQMLHDRVLLVAPRLEVRLLSWSLLEVVSLPLVRPDACGGEGWRRMPETSRRSLRSST
mmetsp:Transcript_22257/g.45450  ORF Transcript_22257/g.45450 Transcript_22257/m.45450 type:complete len:239 (-) Transcript_22257:468-1184(-)